VVIGAAAATLVLAVAAWLCDRRRRVYADHPTTPAAAVFAGRNEVKGRAWAARPLASHRTKTRSVWWDYELEEERRHTSTSGKTTTTTKRWHSIDTKRAALPAFELVDDTGAVTVRLDRARVSPRQIMRETFHDDDRGFLSKMFSSKTGRYRETERVVGVGDSLFVVGEAVLDERTGVPHLTGGVLVSTRTERSHTRWIGVSVGLLVLAAAAGAAGTSGLLLRPDDPGHPLAWAPGLAAALLVLAGAWLVTVHNRLRLIAQGAERAWSLLDVQLTRRSDLVPNLASVVAACARHEREVIEAVTAERVAAARPDADPARRAGTQTAQLRQVLAVAERHPELRSDESFLRLQDELADTETRIAASRSFYNDSVTLLRDRSGAFPGLLVARRLQLPTPDLISADGFEHTVPQVEHAFGDVAG
jgi:LemA protein